MSETTATHALFGDTDRVSGIPDPTVWLGCLPMQVGESSGRTLGDSGASVASDPACAVDSFESVVASFVGDYLADAFGVWDCEGCGWVGGAPVVLRFEEADLVVARAPLCAGDDSADSIPGSLNAWRGSVDVEEPVLRRGAVDLFDDGLPGGGACLQWARLSGCSPCIGGRLVRFEAPQRPSCPSCSAAGDAATVRLLLDDGGVLELRLP